MWKQKIGMKKSKKSLTKRRREKRWERKRSDCAEKKARTNVSAFDDDDKKAS